MTDSRAILAPGGPLSRALDGYEDREGQLQMADAVERALAEGRPLLCEAGTGTGKTLAYLVPALLSGLRVVVSTATKALEEQIFHKDLPLLRRHLGKPPEVALAKGLGNYLCLRRFQELRSGSAAISDPHLGRSLPMLEAWAEETETGDVSELTALAEGDPLWREVSSSSETRIGSACEHHERCFVTRMKRDIARAQIVVVNHHLFFADLAVKGAAGQRAFAAGVLPPYDAVIFDEAHQLEDIATAYFGTRVSRGKIESMLRDADRAFLASGLSDRLLSRGEGSALTAMVRDAADDLFALLAALADASGDRGSADGKVILERDAWSGPLLAAYHRLDTGLEALAGYAEANKVREAVALVAQRAAIVREDAARVVDPATHHVTWVEARERRARGPRPVSFGASPIDLGRLFREQVFDRIGAVVLTSATLTTASPGRVPDFGFLRSRVGLDGGDDLGVLELSVASPFDHRARSLLYTPGDLPPANDATFVARAAERIAELIGVTGGGAFVLCTSNRAMRALGVALRARLPRPPLVQGEAPKSALLARFRADGHAALVATMSFWEGVDVPGDALRLVVIEKIPFAVPTDPIVVARCAAIEARGENPFLSYSVPQAAITLKQGFGRLLRTQADRGVVAILDGRIRSRGYGRALLESLPPAPRTDSLDDVRAFWATFDAKDPTMAERPRLTPPD